MERDGQLQLRSLLGVVLLVRQELLIFSKLELPVTVAGFLFVMFGILIGLTQRGRNRVI